MVLNPERRNNLALRLCQVRPYPIHEQVWLTTFKEVTTDPLGGIWIRPLDYLNATAGTTFAPALVPRSEKIYKRSTARERLIEEKIAKHPLLDYTSIESQNQPPEPVLTT